MVLRTKRGLDAAWEYLVVDPATGAVEAVADVADIPSTADIKTIASETFDGLKSGLISVAQALAEAFQDLGSGIANATLDVLKAGGVAIVDGLDNTFDYLREKLRGKEPDVIAAFTAGTLVVLCGLYLWNAAKRGTITYTE